MTCLYSYLPSLECGFPEAMPFHLYMWVPYGYSLMLYECMHELINHCSNDTKTEKYLDICPNIPHESYVGPEIDSGASHFFLFLRRLHHDSLFYEQVQMERF